MELNIRDGEKIAEIWLTGAEARDNALKRLLEPVYAQYAAKRYTVAVYESGSGDLFEGTRGLILQNLKQLPL